MIEGLCGHLGLSLDEVIWFEHGSVLRGSPVGCGTDHAHIHVILRPRFSFNAFMSCANSMAELDWSETAADRAYSSLPEQDSYLLAGSGKQVFWASNVETTGSQFLRRVVSKVTDQAEFWDYRRYSHAGNIAQTIDTFRSLENAAPRGR